MVREAALEVAEGELVAVLGANGAGKTTLMRALSGLIRPIGRRGAFPRTAHRQLAGDRIARAGLVLVPEGRQVFPELSVIDNLRLGAYARRSDDEASRIEELLDRFPALEDAPPPARGPAVGRRAADAGDRPRPDGAPAKF